MEIKREYYLDKLIKRQNNGLIKVITDIRRCGKSYLLNTLFYNYLIESDGGVLQRGKYHYYIFSKGGFTKGLQELASKVEVILLTLEDLYK